MGFELQPAGRLLAPLAAMLLPGKGCSEQDRREAQLHSGHRSIFQHGLVLHPAAAGMGGEARISRLLTISFGYSVASTYPRKKYR